MKKEVWIAVCVIAVVGLVLLLLFWKQNNSSAVGPGAKEAMSSAEIQKLEAEFQDLRQQANAALDQAQQARVDAFAREIASADAKRLGSLLIREAGFGHVGNMQQLIRQGANVNAEEFGETPLLKAIKANQSQAVLLLLEAGADVNQPAKSGDAALQTAVDFGQADMVQLLVQQPNIQINQPDAGGNTVLMKAAQAGRLEMVQTLVAAGAEAGIKNQRGLTALDMAKAKNHTAVAEFLTLSQNDVQPNK